jgi:hypothetical protein
MIKKRTTIKKKISKRSKPKTRKRDEGEYYCIAQCGYAILSVGRDPREAVIRYINEGYEPGRFDFSTSDFDVPASQRHIGGTYLYRCTPAVVDAVIKHGGSIPFDENKKWIWLHSEQEP